MRVVVNGLCRKNIMVVGSRPNGITATVPKSRSNGGGSWGDASNGFKMHAMVVGNR